jgi:putative ABC transport system ATP-binding protein
LDQANEAMADGIPLVRLQNVVKTYHTAAGEFSALRAVSIDIYPGEFVGIIGRSGAGKSTLINMVTGVDRPTSGEILIGGVSLNALNENQLALWRGRNLGVIHQSFQLLPTLSLLDNVCLAIDLCGLYRGRKSMERAMRLLTKVGLEEHVRKPPTRISGGQQQRVAIARALANDPPIIVADEPTGNLDSATAEAIFELFVALVQEGKTIVMVTHDSSLAQRFSRIVYLADGELLDAALPQGQADLGRGNAH